MKKKTIEYNPRQYGKSYKVFNEFQVACKNGERVILHGMDYVAMDRTSYEELKKRADNPILFIKDETK